jgi:hypothetical protein
MPFLSIGSISPSQADLYAQAQTCIITICSHWLPLKHPSGPLSLQPLPPIPPATLPFNSASMPDSGITIDGGLREPQRRKIGGLFDSEMWWGNRYHDIEARGYRLRARYHPDWHPSWEESGQDFFNTEDGQATIVGIRWLVLPALT